MIWKFSIIIKSEPGFEAQWRLHLQNYWGQNYSLFIFCPSPKYFSIKQFDMGHWEKIEVLERKLNNERLTICTSSVIYCSHNGMFLPYISEGGFNGLSA